jgi:choline dehydrogenase
MNLSSIQSGFHSISHVTFNLLQLPNFSRYLSTQHDVDVLVRGIRGAFKIAHTYPLSTVTDIGSTHPQFDHRFERLSDQELGEIVRDKVETLYHPFGTCTMGKAENPAAVLDTQMRVRGVVGLRVCDASVYPKLVSGHTVSSCLVFDGLCGRKLIVVVFT